MNLRVITKGKLKSLGIDEEELEPATPTTEFLLTEAATLYVLAILEFDVPINIQAARPFIQDVFLHIHPRFSCIPIEDDKGRKMWKKVEVNAGDHIKIPTLPQDLPSKSYSEQFDDYISKIATLQLPQHKPLWQIHIFNYPTNKAVATLIIKFHHAIADGNSLMGVVMTCFQRVDNPTLPPTFPLYTKKTSMEEHNILQSLIKKLKSVPKFLSCVFHSLYDLGQTLKVMAFEDECTPIRSGNTNMDLPYSARICSVNLSLKNIKRIKSLLGVTVNDVIVGIISFATRLYIQEIDQGRLKNTRMTTSIAANLRSIKEYTSPEEMRKESTWGNKTAFIILPLPNIEEDDLRNPLKFIMKSHKIIKRKKSTMCVLFLMAWLLDAIRTIGGIQVAVRAFERSWKNSSFVMTSLIGPSDQISLANHPVKGFYFVATGLKSSLVVTVLSYMEDLRLGLVVENGYIDQQRLITCVERAYQLILQSATTSTKYVAK